MDAMTAYRLYSGETTKAVERISTRPDVVREVEYYQENISNIKSIDDFVEDRRIFNFAMQSYGLGEMSYAKGLVKKLLEGGIDDPDSMANRLTDPRYQALAKDFNFVQFDEATTAFTSVTQGVVDSYYQQTLENDAGVQNSGTRLAMYFERKVGDITSAENILGDAALLKFTQTAFNLPSTMSFLSIDKQADMINERLDIESLKNPEELEKLVNRFLVTWDVQNPSFTAVPPLISSFGNTNGLSLDLLTSIQGLKNNF